MATPAHVQGATAGNSAASGVTSMALAFPSNVAAGDLLLVYVGWYTGSASPGASAVDSQGNTWKEAISSSSAAYNTAILWAKAKSSGANTVTVSFPSAGYTNLTIDEFSGVNAFDVANTAPAVNNQTSNTTSSIITNYAIELLYAGFNVNTSITSAGSGYTEAEVAGGWLTEFRAVTSTGTYTASANGSSGNWAGDLIASFYEAASSSSTASDSLTLGSSASQNMAAARNASDSLTTASTASAIHGSVSAASDSLVLASSAVANQGGSRAVGDSLTLGSSANASGTLSLQSEIESFNPRHYWRLNETTGTTATDDGSALTNGIYTGGYTLDETGLPLSGDPAVLLDGSSGFIQTTVSHPIVPPAAFGVFFKTTNPGGIMGMGTSDVDSGATSPYALYVGSDGKLYGGFYSGTSYITLSSSNTVDDGNWHLAAIAWDASYNMSLILDGQVVATNTNTVAPPSSNNYWLIGLTPSIASWPNGSSDYFNGILSEAVFFLVLSGTSGTIPATADWQKIWNAAIPPFSNTASSDSLTFASSAHANISASRAVSDTLTLASTATAHTKGSRTDSDSLTLGSTAEAHTAASRTATDTLTLASTAVAHIHETRSASDSLTLASSASGQVGGARTTSDSLTLIDRSTASVQVRASINTSASVAFSDSASANTTGSRSTSDSMPFSDSTSAGAGAARSVSDTTTFSDTVASHGGGSQAASDSLAFTITVSENLRASRTPADSFMLASTAKATISEHRSTSDSLTFAGSAKANVAAARQPQAGLSFSDSARGNMTAHRTVINTMTFMDGVAVRISGSRSAQDGITLYGTASGFFTPPPFNSIPTSYTYEYISGSLGGLQSGGGELAPAYFNPDTVLAMWSGNVAAGNELPQRVFLGHDEGGRPQYLFRNTPTPMTNVQAQGIAEYAELQILGIVS